VAVSIGACGLSHGNWRLPPASGSHPRSWQWLGFHSGGGHDGQASLDALKYVYCFGPVPFYVLGGVLLYWFPITARRHDIIRRRLHQRQQRAG